MPSPGNTKIRHPAGVADRADLFDFMLSFTAQRDSCDALNPEMDAWYGTWEERHAMETNPDGTLVHYYLSKARDIAAEKGLWVLPRNSQ